MRNLAGALAMASQDASAAIDSLCGGVETPDGFLSLREAPTKPAPLPLQSAQHLDPHRLMSLKLDLRSHDSRNTPRQASGPRRMRTPGRPSRLTRRQVLTAPLTNDVLFLRRTMP